jgi:hypothetical protein
MNRVPQPQRKLTCGAHTWESSTYFCTIGANGGKSQELPNTPKCPECGRSSIQVPASRATTKEAV